MNTPTVEQLRAAWSAAPYTTREILENLYGADIKADIRDRVKTYKDALCFTTSYRCQINDGVAAFEELQTVVKALNEGWTPDWSNEDEKKWYPWFGFRDGRFVFSSVGCVFTHSFLGSRLCFRTRELAEYAGKQFEDLYNQFLK